MPSCSEGWTCQCHLGSCLPRLLMASRSCGLVATRPSFGRENRVLGRAKNTTSDVTRHTFDAHTRRHGDQSSRAYEGRCRRIADTRIAEMRRVIDPQCNPRGAPGGVHRRDTAKLDLRATLNLAQVSKWYRDAVWSVDGMRSLGEKVRPVMFGSRPRSTPIGSIPLVVTHGNLPAVRAQLEYFRRVPRGQGA